MALEKFFYFFLNYVMMAKKIIPLFFAFIASISFYLPSATTMMPVEPENATYHNATILIISNIYHVDAHNDEKIVLRSFRQPFLPGIFYVSDENGIEELNPGGWMNSIVTIYNFKGFFKDWIFKEWGLYVGAIGKCEKIEIEWFR